MCIHTHTDTNKIKTNLRKKGIKKKIKSEFIFHKGNLNTTQPFLVRKIIALKIFTTEKQVKGTLMNDMPGKIPTITI